MFLHADERWDPLRSYLFETIGEQGTTCVFGVIIYLVCPVMFCIQNLLLGLCLFEHSRTNLAHAINHILQSMRYQLVVLYDLSLFKEQNKPDQKSSWRGVVRIVIGYFSYVLPMVALITLSIRGQGEWTVCTSLNAPFLLDNEVVPVVNISNLYQSRKLFAKRKRDWSAMMVWDLWKSERAYQYWPLENITDLIMQYNYVGFHDICIYPKMEDLTQVQTKEDYSLKGIKGFQVYVEGYVGSNTSGADNNYVLFQGNKYFAPTKSFRR